MVSSSSLKTVNVRRISPGFSCVCRGCAKRWREIPILLPTFRVQHRHSPHRHSAEVRHMSARGQSKAKCVQRRQWPCRWRCTMWAPRSACGGGVGEISNPSWHFFNMASFRTRQPDLAIPCRLPSHMQKKGDPCVMIGFCVCCSA